MSTASPSDLPDAASTKIALTPHDWIEAAGQILINMSIDAVRVESLSKTLGVTRGSFYWHFKDRNDLLQQLLQSWRDSATEQIIDRFEGRNIKPKELVRDLLRLPFRGEAAEKAASTELAIRAWARRDDMARQFVDEVDSKRLLYIGQCFSALGFDFAEARVRAFTLYAYELSESLLTNQGNEVQKQERCAFIERVLLDGAS